ncbi:DUF421 domain-containing protein [Paenimyroides viscosum]|uniref:DUF421 domain-containing protein n=1 Tax=Paenimyroides viscosum TaxID=2488729 RepID=A0A3P1AS41_9FLAO|nr:YetF domain-containing protein [Paenimyroides viscosum]RRA91704.1 DUF421 domain-containing protein [Paenimyroides viscosum]
MELEEFLFGETTSAVLISITLRTFVMFVVILVFLRLLGKRGIKQLSVFELVVILGLGSAAGDPMIYKEIGIINALVAFIVITICYKILTVLVFKFKWIETLVEGKEVYIIKKGKFSINEFKKETLSKDEFFMELRLLGVYHLGQVEYAILETTGEVSVYFYPDNQIKYGLPILPNSLINVVKSFNVENFYSCTFCGQTIEYANQSILKCFNCNKNEWVKASNKKKLDKNN